jgi:hypothetical protein
MNNNRNVPVSIRDIKYHRKCSTKMSRRNNIGIINRRTSTNNNIENNNEWEYNKITTSPVNESQLHQNKYIINGRE